MMLANFAQDRDWDLYHKPRNLIMALTGEVGELAEIFHPDIVVHFTGGNYEWKLQGRDEYVESIKKSFHNAAIGQGDSCRNLSDRGRARRGLL